MDNAPVSIEIANKLREEIEDEKKSKRFLEKNMEDLKLKLEIMKSDGIEQLQVSNKYVNNILFYDKFIINCIHFTIKN